MLVDVVDRDFLLHSGQCFIERDNVRCLGEAPRVIPAFGFKPKIPFREGKSDRTEVDMKLGDLMVEAKLTETDFRAAEVRKVERYRDFEEFFDPTERAA